MLLPGEDLQHNTRQAWNNLKNRMENDGLISQTNHPWDYFPIFSWRLAASILLIIALSIPAIFYFQGKMGEGNKNILLAEDQTTSYDLPDGSRVFLKKGSEIELIHQFENNRSLSMQGEAYFDVLADPSHPFRIITGEAIITVLGTEFNIKENKESNCTEILVESGKVLVQGKENKKEITLEKGEFAISSIKDLNKEIQTNSNYLAWKTRIFEFRNESLSEVFKLIEDVYQVKILVKEESINNLRLTSSYNKQSAEAILSTISAAFGLKILQENERYVVSLYP